MPEHARLHALIASGNSPGWLTGKEPPRATRDADEEEFVTLIHGRDFVELFHLRRLLQRAGIPWREDGYPPTQFPSPDDDPPPPRVGDLIAFDVPKSDVHTAWVLIHYGMTRGWFEAGR